MKSPILILRGMPGKNATNYYGLYIKVYPDIAGFAWYRGDEIIRALSRGKSDLCYF